MRVIEISAHVFEAIDQQTYRDEPVEFAFIPEFLEANVSEFVWIEKPQTPQLPCACVRPECRREHDAD